MLTATMLSVQLSAAPIAPLPEVIPSVTDEESAVTTLPPASSTITSGCAIHAVAAVPPPGCALNTSSVPTPTVASRTQRR